MPPKKSKGSVSDQKIPRVIIQPLKAGPSGEHTYRFATTPPSANLFNNPLLSDIKLIVGDESFYGHRLILCAGSDVFARMLSSDWAESQSPELVLQEDEDCMKVFHRFLFYFYTGTIVIGDDCVFQIFMLADKYNVRSLYEECVNHIVKGLKVFVVTRSSSSSIEIIQKNKEVPVKFPGFTTCAPVESSSSSFSDCSDSESNDSSDVIGLIDPIPGPSKPAGHTTKQLIASETFPLSFVMKMLCCTTDECIQSAALYNMEARLCNQICNGNYGVWNDLDQKLLVRMLNDPHFYCNEYTLYQATKSWFKYQSERCRPDIMKSVLCLLRYPILSAEELYCVESDPLIQQCSEALLLVKEAIRYKLFHDCSKAADKENWRGSQFENRTIKYK